MKNIILHFFILILLLFQSTEAFGQELNMNKKPPLRIISLAPNMTEIIFALGLGDKLIGVTDFCDYPPEVKTKSKIGGMTNPSIEAIIRLKPDLVIMTTDGNLQGFEKKLLRLNIPTHVFLARTISDYTKSIRELGLALGVEKRANQYATETEIALKRLKALGERRKTQSGVFIVWPEPLIVAGPGTFTAEAMAIVGLTNVAQNARTAWPKFSLEELIRSSPEIILTSKKHKEDYLFSNNFIKKLGSTPAIQNNRIFFTTDALLRLGPRTIGGIEELLILLSDEN
ncbi:MAG: ABC transporter substrate-binding protein [Deltaproteobacteria bacterium]|nr:ABC transporter substrate-binding protein [Deltaproteobacteria bacterium]